jgi:predicted nucleotidyltransferase
MVLSSGLEDAKLRLKKEYETIQQAKAFKETKLPDGAVEDEKNRLKGLRNPFLDTSVRELVDVFVLTWHKIIFELLDVEKYNVLYEDTEWWDKAKALFFLLKEIFWVDDRLFYVGVGLVIASFFVFFILVTQ